MTDKIKNFYKKNKFLRYEYTYMSLDTKTYTATILQFIKRR